MSLTLNLPNFLRSEPEAPPTLWSRTVDAFDQCSQLGWFQRMSGFALCVIGALFFLFTALYSTPYIMIGRADKFAVPFIIANVCFMVASCFIVGLRKQLAEMFSPERRIAAVLYLTAMCATLYLSLFVRRWYLVMPAVFVQLFSLFWYAFTAPSSHVICCSRLLLQRSR